MQTIDLPNNWRPRPYQVPLWRALENGTLRAFAICHRRWGKDDVALHRAAVAAHERVGNYWHLLPEQEHARRAIWDAVNPHSGKRRIDEAFPPQIRKRTVNQAMMIEFRNGSIWQVLGSDNYNQYIGASPIGVVFSEFALADPAAWAFIRPILLENKGWALFITTSRGRNHAVTFYEAALKDPAWFAVRQPATETDVFSSDELAAERRGMIAEFGEAEGRARYEQEYLCSFDAPMSGSVWGAELMAAEAEGRICAVPHDPNVGVHTWWDLGVRNATVIWFTQDAGREVHVIDHARIVGGGLPGAVQELRRRPYSYVAHHAPHDIRVTELGTGRSRLETAEALGIRFEIVPNIGLEDGISAARGFFGLCWFDRDRTAEGRAALAAYHRAYDPARKVYSSQPVHDWCLAADTEVLTRDGKRKISELPANGHVLTLCGWKRYRNPRVTQRNVRVVAVRFGDGTTVRCTPEHLFMTEFGWRYAGALSPGSAIRSGLKRSLSSFVADYIEYGPPARTSLAGEGRSIVTFGRRHSVRFRAGVISIIVTAIRATIGLETLNACLLASTPASVGQALMPRHRAVFRIVPERGRQSGIAPTRDESGTAGTPCGQRTGRSGSGSLRTALNAALNSCASHVIAGIVKSIVARNARWLRIERVEWPDEREDVWCITVPGYEHFALANGAISHNSSDDADGFRYLAVGHRFTERRLRRVQDARPLPGGWMSV